MPRGEIGVATPKSSVRPQSAGAHPKKSGNPVPSPMTEAETTEYRKYIEIQTKYLGKTAGEAALEYLSSRSRQGSRGAVSSQVPSSSLDAPGGSAQRDTLVTLRTNGQGAPRGEHAAGRATTPFPWPFTAEVHRERPQTLRMSDHPGSSEPYPAKKPALEAIVHAYTQRHFPERKGPAWDAWYTPPARLNPDSNSRLHRKQRPAR